MSVATPLAPTGMWVRHGKVRFDLPRGRWTYKLWPNSPAGCPSDGRNPKAEPVPGRPGQLACPFCGIDLSERP